VYRVDLHTHTRFFHAGHGPTRFDPLGLRGNGIAADFRGLDAVATTNHDYAFEGACSVPAIPGIEVSTTMGHVLVVGPDPPTLTTPGELTPAETVDVAHENDCAAILAHPYRGSAARSSGAAFDAVELNGKNPEHVQRTVRLARRLDLPLVGGSDAHVPVEVGRAFTVVEAAELSPRAVADAVRAGDVKPRIRLGSLDRVVDRLYTEIHRWKGVLD
jgi:hypothetical protein